MIGAITLIHLTKFIVAGTRSELQNLSGRTPTASRDPTPGGKLSESWCASATSDGIDRAAH